MVFVLTCALCAAQPALPSVVEGDPGHFQLLEERLTLREPRAAPVPLPSSSPLVLGRLPYGGGDGEDHSDHMGTMWIVMGVMMGVMLVGMGVYVARHGTSSLPMHAAPVLSPAQLALPVTDARGGGG